MCPWVSSSPTERGCGVFLLSGGWGWRSERCRSTRRQTEVRGHLSSISFVRVHCCSDFCWRVQTASRYVDYKEAQRVKSPGTRTPPPHNSSHKAQVVGVGDGATDHRFSDRGAAAVKDIRTLAQNTEALMIECTKKIIQTATMCLFLLTWLFSSARFFSACVCTFLEGIIFMQPSLSSHYQLYHKLKLPFFSFFFFPCKSSGLRAC